jgi:hypothetical protein
VTSISKSRPSSESFLELLGQQAVVPIRDLGQAIVGNSEGSGLRRGEVIEAERRHLGPAELTTGQQPPMTRDHIVFAIDQNRNIEAEGSDAVGDFSDLLLAVPARVGGVRLQLVDATIDDVQTQTAL